jgi:hypothetical protein
MKFRTETFQLLIMANTSNVWTDLMLVYRRSNSSKPCVVRADGFVWYC